MCASQYGDGGTKFGRLWPMKNATNTLGVGAQK